MPYLEIKAYSNYTNVYMLMYKQLRWYLTIALVVFILTVVYWFNNNIGWGYILLPTFMYVVLLAIPIQEVLQHGPKKLLCHIAFDELITKHNKHIPVKEIVAIEYIARQDTKANLYDIILNLNDNTRIELISGLNTKTMFQIHMDLQTYVNVECIYLLDYLYKPTKRYPNIEDIL